ncbi:MAG: hypothetical protein L0Y57_05285 [Beijerinckiaceae bacterium]|nr:hypothetical protein [Beijerinckiaceae bacterium]
MNALPSEFTRVTHSALIRRALWFNTAVLAGVLGMCCGLGLMAATYASIALTGENAGHYLNLLGVFLPGYSATPAGAWIGGFWMFWFAALSSAVVYQVYARAIRMDFAKRISYDNRGLQTPAQLIILISGPAFGFAMGAMLALQLIVSTLWLVVRGTAAESVHAALLANYLPFYTPSISGAFIGGAWLFSYGFALSYLFAVIYNLVVNTKSRQHPHER